MGMVHRAAVAAGAALGLLLAGMGPAGAEPVALPVPTIQVALDLAGPVQFASKSGRYVITGGALFDRSTRRTLKRFPGAVESISDDGRYVTYSVPGASGRKYPYASQMQRVVKVYDRRTKRTRTATTTSSGRALRPSWRTSCTSSNPGVCEEGVPIQGAPQLQGGAISGNGHYVVFCANYVQRDRVDLYIKNWRSKKLTRINGACSYWDYWDSGSDSILAPSISEDGDTILLPGRLTVAEDSSTWAPTRALLHRKRVVEVGGRAASMTHDGRIVSVAGPFSGVGVPDFPPHPVTWFDLPTGTSTPSSPACTRLGMRNASRHGRYFVAYQFAGRDACVQGGPLEVPTLTITDRTAGITYDLSAALAAMGYALPLALPNTVDVELGSRDALPVLSGDGKVVFAPTTMGWVSLTWTP